MMSAALPRRRLAGWILALLALASAWGAAAPAHAQDFPELTGRVVDQANLLSPEQEAALTQRLEALEQASSRQLVIATIPSLQDSPIEDYGFQLGRRWGIGQEGANNGVLLIVAPNERKVRIEVGYGLEPILPDALSGRIIREQVVPRFREDDYAGGIEAATAAIIEQLQAPPEAAEQRAVEAARQQRERGGGGPWVPILFWGAVILFILISSIFGRKGRGRRYRRGRGDDIASVILWSAIGEAMGDAARGSGRGWGGGGWGGSGGGGFGGFSGGGGSFGGGGASGSW